MAKTNQEKLNDIWWLLCAPDGREFLANLTGAAAARHTLNTPIQRGGAGAGIGDGKTSLGSMVAWNDDHTIQTLAAVAASTAASGGSVEDIKAAVVDALKENVVQVDVSVSGAGK